MTVDEVKEARALGDACFRVVGERIEGLRRDLRNQTKPLIDIQMMRLAETQLFLDFARETRERYADHE